MSDLKITYDSGTCEVISLRKTEYSDGNLAVVANLIWDDCNAEKVRVSVNLPDQTNVLGDGEFYAKNWSEGERMFNVLISAGWIVDTGRGGQSGFVRPPVCKIGSDAVMDN